MKTPYLFLVQFNESGEVVAATRQYREMLELSDGTTRPGNVMDPEPLPIEMIVELNATFGKVDETLSALATSEPPVPSIMARMAAWAGMGQ